MEEAPGIAKRTREKVALVVFAVLVILAVVVLSSYFFTGRSWNVAASFVDDTVGQMKGYTAVVYAGTAQPEEVAISVDGGTPDPANAASHLNVPTELSAEGSTAEESPDVADSVGLGLLSLLPPLPGIYEGVYVSDVRDLYEQKEARVVSLDVAHSERYALPKVLVGDDGTRIGVFSVSSYTTRARLKQYRAYFDKERVNAVVCIAPRTALLADLSQMSVVIVTDDPDETNPRGRFVGDTLVAAAAPIDTVGVILFSPNYTPSAKVVDGL